MHDFCRAGCDFATIADTLVFYGVIFVAAIVAALIKPKGD